MISTKRTIWVQITFIIFIFYFWTLCIIIVLRQGILCVYIGICIQTGGGIFASQELRSVFLPLSFTLDAISYNSIISEHCRLLDFFAGIDNRIIFAHVEQEKK
jgi:hypothetical protein